MQMNWPLSRWYNFLLKGILEQTIKKSVLEYVIICWKNTDEVLFDQNESFTAFFKEFDHKFQNPFLNKFLWQFLSKAPIKGISRTTATSKMGFFMTLVNSWKPLSDVTKRFVLDVAGALDMPRNNAQKQPWWAIPSFIYTLLLLGEKCVTEVEDCKVVCLAKLVLQTALTAEIFLGTRLRYRKSKYLNYR